MQARLGAHDWAVVLVLYTAITLGLSFGFVTRLNDTLVGINAGDNAWYVWSMWIFRHALEAGQDPAHTHNIFALLGSVQIFIDGFFNEALGWPLQWFLSPTGAYDTVLLLSFVLSGFTMYLLAREFVSSRVACFGAGYLYDFSTFHFARAEGHLGLLTMEGLPFFAWRAWVLYRRPGWTNAALLGLGLALVPLSEIYYLPYFAIPFVLVFAATVLTADRGWLRDRQHLLLVGFSMLLALVVAGIPLADYLRVDPDVRDAANAVARTDLSSLSADLMSFFLPSGWNPLFGAITAPIYKSMPGTGNLVEQSEFLGYPTIALGALAFAFRRNRHRIAGFWLVLAIVGLILSLGPNLVVFGHSLVALPTYRLIYGWPYISTFRAPNRLAVVPLLALSVLSAYTIEGIIAYFRGSLIHLRLLIAAGVVVGAVSLIENSVVSIDLPTTPMPVPTLYRTIAADSTNVLLLDAPLEPSALEMYYQITHHKLLVNGYVPRPTDRMANSILTIPYMPMFDPGTTLQEDKIYAKQRDIYPVSETLKEMLARHRIGYLVFHPYQLAMPGTASWMLSYLERELGPPFQSDSADGLVTWHIAPISRTAPASFAVHLGSGWLPGAGFTGSYMIRVARQDAQFLIDVQQRMSSHVQFQAYAYNRPLTMEVRLNGTPLKTVSFPQAAIPQIVDLGEIPLRRGRNVLELHSIQGCSRPIDINPVNQDTRCYSFGIQRVDVH